MKIVIDIPKEFETHFNQDRFEDSLHRLSVDAHLIAGNYEQETAIMLIHAFKNATPLPKGHGRLIDEDELDFEDVDFYEPMRGLEVYKIIDNAPTIIEADKQSIGQEEKDG